MYWTPSTYRELSALPVVCPKNTHYTYLLTHSTVQSPPWEANWFAASPEIPRISRNPKVHYRTHNRPPPLSILGQPNPVHIPTSHLLEIHPNTIHPSTPRSPQWSLSLRFPHQDPIHHTLLTHTRHMPIPSHVSRFYHPHDIGWAVHTIQSWETNLNQGKIWVYTQKINLKRRHEYFLIILTNKPYCYHCFAKMMSHVFISFSQNSYNSALLIPRRDFIAVFTKKKLV